MSHQGDATTLDVNIMIEEYKSFIGNLVNDGIQQRAITRQMKQQYEAKISQLQNEVEQLKQMQEISMASNLIDVETPAC